MGKIKDLGIRRYGSGDGEYLFFGNYIKEYSMPKERWASDLLECFSELVGAPFGSQILKSKSIYEQLAKPIAEKIASAWVKGSAYSDMCYDRDLGSHYEDVRPWSEMVSRGRLLGMLAQETPSAVEQAAQQVAQQAAKEAAREAGRQAGLAQEAARQAAVQLAAQEAARQAAVQLAAEEAARQAATEIAEEAARQVAEQRLDIAQSQNDSKSLPFSATQPPLSFFNTPRHGAMRPTSPSRTQSKRQTEACLEHLLKYAFEAITSQDQDIFRFNDAAVKPLTQLFNWDLLAIMLTHMPRITPNSHAREEERVLEIMPLIFNNQDRYKHALTRMVARFNLLSNGICPEVKAISEMSGTTFKVDKGDSELLDLVVRGLRKKAQSYLEKDEPFFIVTPKSVDDMDFQDESMSKLSTDIERSIFATQVALMEINASFLDSVDFPEDVRARITALMELNEAKVTQSTMSC